MLSLRGTLSDRATIYTGRLGPWSLWDPWAYCILLILLGLSHAYDEARSREVTNKLKAITQHSQMGIGMSQNGVRMSQSESWRDVECHGTPWNAMEANGKYWKLLEDYVMEMPSTKR